MISTDCHPRNGGFLQIKNLSLHCCRDRITFTSGQSVSDTLSVRLLSCYTLWQNTFLCHASLLCADPRITPTRPPICMTCGHFDRHRLVGRYPRAPSLGASDISDIALRSPFDLSSSAAIPPSAALWVTSDKAYSLFVIGLLFNFDMCILAHKNPFVNTFCKNIFNSVSL